MAMLRLFSAGSLVLAITVMSKSPCCFEEGQFADKDPILPEVGSAITALYSSLRVAHICGLAHRRFYSLSPLW